MQESPLYEGINFRQFKVSSLPRPLWRRGLPCWTCVVLYNARHRRRHFAFHLRSKLLLGCHTVKLRLQRSTVLPGSCESGLAGAASLGTHTYAWGADADADKVHASLRPDDSQHKVSGRVRDSG